MEGLSGNCFASHCRDFISHPALGRHSGNLANHQSTVCPDITAQHIGRQCPAHQASGTSLRFGSPFYGCRLLYPHNVNLQQKAYSYHPAEKCMESSSALPADELSSRSKELGIYPSFASSHQTVPGCLDVPAVPGISAHPESRHETLIPMGRYQHWAMSNGWDEQLYCSKEQTHFNHLWKSQFSDVVPHQIEINGFPRGRKKRVPYNKIQLKELEKEYAASMFITKDMRRRISAATNLSERQVTIWFQNRRVKEKKLVCKSMLSSHLHVN
ncbi:homeobox protein Hox-C13b-like [Sinocyclocheilus rhinocerous]|uniref:Homeobox protein Hox-C13b-like n=1 Tax=Sinocyclocheilus rhinocerous TaxID=307959 RepID=A0A673HN40_9TELE|nr:PREDICTED: homeobox protein Hox-C13b-like [Sinocyclocheilus rhinocerous]